MFLVDTNGRCADSNPDLFRVLANFHRVYAEVNMAKSTKKKPTKKISVRRPPIALYGVPINEAAASGDLRQMKSMAAKARKHISDVSSALARLEKAIAKAGG